MRSSGWRAGAVLVGALVAGACGAPVDGWCADVMCDGGVLEGDAGRGDAGSLDAGAMHDAGHPRDAGVDADHELDAGAPRDAGAARDAGGGDRDAGADSGFRRSDAGTSDAGLPECSVFPQSGCGDGEACREYGEVRWDGGAMFRRVAPHCEPAGTLPEHYGDSFFGDPDTCRVSAAGAGQSGDLCEADLFCSDYIIGRGLGCVRRCDPAGEPCPSYWSTRYARLYEQHCDDSGAIPFCARGAAP